MIQKQVPGDGVEPDQKRNFSLPVAPDCLPGIQEDLGRQVLGLAILPDPVKEIAIDVLGIEPVKFPEGGHFPLNRSLN